MCFPAVEFIDRLSAADRIPVPTLVLHELMVVEAVAMTIGVAVETTVAAGQLVVMETVAKEEEVDEEEEEEVTSLPNSTSAFSTSILSFPISVIFTASWEAMLDDVVIAAAAVAAHAAVAAAAPPPLPRPRLPFVLTPVSARSRPVMTPLCSLTIIGVELSLFFSLELLCPL